MEYNIQGKQNFSGVYHTRITEQQRSIKFTRITEQKWSISYKDNRTTEKYKNKDNRTEVE